MHARVQKLTPAGGGHSKDRERNPDCPLFPLEDGKLQLVENENEEHQTSPPPPRRRPARPRDQAPGRPTVPRVIGMPACC